MPSVQWGSTNSAVLVFTPISAALGALSAAGGSLAILWQPTSPSDGAGLLNSGGTAWYHGLQLASHLIDDDGLVAVNAPTNVTTAHWYISVVDWPTNASPALERFHWIDLTSAGAWGHENSAVNNGGNKAGPGTTGKFRIGDLIDQRMTPGTKIALVAAWNTPLGDTNAALLSTAKRTSDWYNNPAGKPIFLSEVTSLAPADVLGASTLGASVTTGLTVGGNPDGGWTFDGPGAYVVQSTGNFVSTAGQTGITSAAFGSAVTPGNMIVVCGYANNLGGGTPQAPTITDSKGNTWPTVDKFQNGVPKDSSEFVYYGHLVVPVSGGGTGFTVTATYHSAAGVSASSNRIFAVEVAGVDTMDGAAVLANATSATAAANFPVASGVPAYVAALAVSENGITAAAPAGWTSRLAEGSETLYDQVALATGTKALSVSAGGSNQWCIIGAAFYKASAGGPVALVPVAAATAQATTLVTAGVIEGPTIISAATAQATAKVTAASVLNPSAASTTQATATVTAATVVTPQPLTPVAQATTTATAAATAPMLITGVSAQAQAQAAVMATAALKLAPSAGATAQATVSLIVPGVAALAPTAQAQAQAQAAVSAPTLLTPVAIATATASASATAAGRLSPTAQAVTQASATVIVLSAPVALTPTAQATAQAQATVTAPGIQFLTPTAQAQAQATGTVTAPVRLTPVAAGVAQATSLVQYPVTLTPVAAGTGNAVAQVTCASVLSPSASSSTTASATMVVAVQLAPLAASGTAAGVEIGTAAQLQPIAQATSTAGSLVAVPVALAPHSSAATRATLNVTAPAAAVLELPLYADVFSGRMTVDVFDPGHDVVVISPRTYADVVDPSTEATVILP